MFIVKNFGKIIRYQHKLIALFCFNIGQNSLNVLGPVCLAHFVPTGKAEEKTLASAHSLPTIIIRITPSFHFLFFNNSSTLSAL